MSVACAGLRGTMAHLSAVLPAAASCVQVRVQEQCPWRCAPAALQPGGGARVQHRARPGCQGAGWVARWTQPPASPIRIPAMAA